MIEVLGPVGMRRFNIEKTCGANEGHTHNYDHVTFVQAGSLKAIWSETADGPKKESKVFKQGDMLLIKATIHHTIKAMEPNTRYACVFTHRDFDSGEAVQEYNGNPSAYE